MVTIKLLLSVFLLVVLLSKTELKWFHTYAGRFKVVLKKVEMCPPNLRGPLSAQYTWRRLRNGGYNINMTTEFGLNDSFGVKWTVSSWSNNGGWKDNAFVVKVDHICTQAARHFTKLMKYASRTLAGEQLYCPFYAGIYRAVNFTVPEKLLASPLLTQFVYGKWRADTQIFKTNGDTVSCIRFLVDTLPT